MASNPRHADHVSGLVFVFSCPPNPSVNHLNFYCIKQVDYIFPCVCTVISHTRRPFLFFTRCDVFCDLLQYTHTEKCYIFICVFLFCFLSSFDLYSFIWGFFQECNKCILLEQELQTVKRRNEELMETTQQKNR